MYYKGNRFAFRLVMFFLLIWVLLFPGLLIFVLLFGIMNYLGLMDIWSGILFLPILLLTIISVVLLDKQMEVFESVIEFKIHTQVRRN